MAIRFENYCVNCKCEVSADFGPRGQCPRCKVPHDKVCNACGNYYTAFNTNTQRDDEPSKCKACGQEQSQGYGVDRKLSPKIEYPDKPGPIESVLTSVANGLESIIDKGIESRKQKKESDAQVQKILDERPDWGDPAQYKTGSGVDINDTPFGQWMKQLMRDQMGIEDYVITDTDFGNPPNQDDSD